MSNLPVQKDYQKAGIIYLQQRTKKGTWLYIKNLKIWLPKIITTNLIGSYVVFRGELYKTKRTKYLIAQAYEVKVLFDYDKIEKKVKKKYYNKPLIHIPLAIQVAIYLTVMGRHKLAERILSLKPKSALTILHNPFNLFLKKMCDYYTSKILADLMQTPSEEYIYPLMVHFLNIMYANRRECIYISSILNIIKKKFNKDITSEEIKQLIDKYNHLFCVGDRVFLSKIFFLRAKCLKMLRTEYTNCNNIPNVLVAPGLEKIFQYRYSVITGKGGTGKTTLIRKLKSSCVNTVFTATTGKAAKRLSEDAVTIHYLLGYGKNGFKNSNIVKTDILVVDEASMLDWYLLYNILTKVNGHIVFVGDPNQLPPTEGEPIFNIIIDSIPEAVISLEKIYRYEKIDCNVYLQPNRDKAIKHIKKIVDYFNSKGLEWQILTPLKMTADVLNFEIQNILFNNFNKKREFNEGDRIIVVKNVYKNGELVASNGQPGEIVSVKENSYIVLLSNNEIFECTSDSIMLSYALTIHKAQGSEYDYVICYIPRGIRKDFLTKELFEVAKTRARKKTFFILEEKLSFF